MDKDQEFARSAVKQMMFQTIGPINVDLFECEQGEVRKEKPDFKKDVKKYKSLGLPLYILVSSVISVYLDARNIASCFLDEIAKDMPIPNQKQVCAIAGELWKDYGIRTGVITVPINSDMGVVYVLFSKDKKELQKTITLINLMIKNGAITSVASPMFFKLIGEILGYPKCCIEEFAKTREKYLKTFSTEDMIENKTQKELAKNDFQEDLAIYTGEFYPCSLNCKESKKNLKHILEVLKKTDEKLEIAYKIFLKENRNFLRNLGKSYSLEMKKCDMKIEELFNQPTTKFGIFMKKLNKKLFPEYIPSENK